MSSRGGRTLLNLQFLHAVLKRLISTLLFLVKIIQMREKWELHYGLLTPSG